eukprot:UN02104
MDAYKRLRGSFAITFPNSNITWQRSIGYMDGTNTTRPNETTKYRIGSMTKAFTAILTMLAIERGYLTLDTTLSHFFPIELYPIAYSDKITIHHLLHMTSDLYNYTDDPEFGLYNGKPKTLDDVLNIIYKHSNQQRDPTTIKTGSYCNTGYYLLGHILPTLFGRKDYKDLLQQELFTPLRLTNISLYSSPEDQHPSPYVEFNEIESFDFTLSYDYAPRKEYYTDNSAVGGAGAIQSSLNDVMSFYHQIFAQHKIINITSIRTMQQYEKIIEGMNYGYGIFQNAYPTSFGHTGVVDGFYSSISMWPLDPTNGDPVNNDPYFIVSYSINGLGVSGDIALNNMLRAAYNLDVNIPNLQILDDQTIYPKLAGIYHSDYAPGINITIVIQNHTIDVVPKKNQTLAFYQTNSDGSMTNRYPMLYVGATGQEKPGDVYIAPAVATFAIFDMEKATMILQLSSANIPFNKYPEPSPTPPTPPDDGKPKPPSHVWIYIVALVVIAAIAITVFVMFFKKKNNKDPMKNHYMINIHH